MQTNVILRQRSNGSVLLIVMGTVIVLAIVLAAVLSLTTHEQRVLARTSAWNAALPAAEAGIEEAMSHLRQVAGGNRAANGWQADGSSFVMTRTNLLNSSLYVVAISSATPPTIISRGEAWCPSAGRRIARTVQVQTASQGGASFAILVKKSVNLGSDFLINSYDDTKGPYSTNTAGDKAAIGTISTNAGMLMLADSKIFGEMYSPPTGSYTIGSHGRVGDMAFASNVANDGKVQAGAYHKDLNVSIDDVVGPTASELLTYSTPTYLGDSKKGPKTFTYNGITYSNFFGGGWSYVLLPGKYKTSTTLSGSILVLGDVTLYVPTSGRIQFGSDQLLAIPKSANSSLKLYDASTTDAVMKDASNDSLDPKRFIYYGLPTTADKKLELTGSGAFAFAGIINAPNLNLRITGSSSGNEDFLGSVIANDFSMSGHTYMHYPESLRTPSGTGEFVIASWTEL